MAHFPLPDDNYAELREAKKIPERLRRPVRTTAIALQRTLPEDQRYKPAVTVEPLKAPEADAETQAAFGAPPIDELVESAGDSQVPVVNGTDGPLVLPTDEQQEAADAYNVALIVAFVSEWSFGPVNNDTAENLPGDAYDALLEEVRRLNKGDEEDGESLASDPSSL